MSIALKRNEASGAFTLIELLVTIALVVFALSITFSTFYSISRAWERGQAMADSLNRGEFVMEQMVSALRSAFYPVSQTSAPSTTNAPPGATNAAVTGALGPVWAPTDYGFVLEDNGDGAGAYDAISWVKTGTALLGDENPLWRGLHRVKVSVEENENFLAVVSRAWRPYGLDINFSADEVPPFVISERVLGMNCRVAREADDDEGWKWEDEWGEDEANRLPLAVEIVLYLASPEESDEPVEIKRAVEIPVAPLSWSADKGRK